MDPELLVGDDAWFAAVSTAALHLGCIVMVFGRVIVPSGGRFGGRTSLRIGEVGRAAGIAAYVAAVSAAALHLGCMVIVFGRVIVPSGGCFGGRTSLRVFARECRVSCEHVAAVSTAALH